MVNFIDVVLTKDGMFCVAPPWVVKEGDLISLQDALTGEKKVHEVISVSTDRTDGDHLAMMKKYVGYPLPRVIEKYSVQEIDWGETNGVE